MPNFVFSLKDSLETISGRLVIETLTSLFRKLHPEKSGWDLSLINIAATNMVDAASEKGGTGRDIAKMFRRQDDLFKQWRVKDEGGVAGQGDSNTGVHDSEVGGTLPNNDHQVAGHGEGGVVSWGSVQDNLRHGSEDIPTSSQDSHLRGDGEWLPEDEEMVDDDNYRCDVCGAIMPVSCAVIVACLMYVLTSMRLLLWLLIVVGT
jgi:DNA polymerase iota